MNENSPTDPFSVATCKAMLEKEGYSLLKESSNAWLAWGDVGKAVKLNSLKELQEYTRERCNVQKANLKPRNISPISPSNQDFEEQPKSDSDIRKAKKCPFCAEDILFEAIKCKYCKEWLDRESSYSETTPDAYPKVQTHSINPESISKDVSSSTQLNTSPDIEISQTHASQESPTQKGYIRVKKYGWKVAEDESREFLSQKGYEVVKKYCWVVKKPSEEQVVIKHLEGLLDYTIRKCNWNVITEISDHPSSKKYIICVYCGEKVPKDYWACTACEKQIVCKNCKTLLTRHKKFAVLYCPSCNKGTSQSSPEIVIGPFFKSPLDGNDPYSDLAEQEYQSRLSKKGYALVRKYGWLAKDSSGTIHKIDSLIDLLKFTIEVCNLRGLGPSDISAMNKEVDAVCCHCDVNLQGDCKYCIKCGADVAGFAEYTVSASASLASRGSRLVAVFIDSILAVIVVALPIFAMINKKGGPDIPPSAFALSIFFIILILYQLVELSTNGQTIGKKAMSIKIVRETDDSNPGFFRAVILRGVLFALIYQIPVIGPIIIILDILCIFSGNRQCAHDHIAGTKVVEA